MSEYDNNELWNVLMDSASQPLQPIHTLTDTEQMQTSQIWHSGNGRFFFARIADNIQTLLPWSNEAITKFSWGTHRNKQVFFF